jgi:membrane protease YdiL (CAAX protease family)
VVSLRPAEPGPSGPVAPLASEAEEPKPRLGAKRALFILFMFIAGQAVAGLMGGIILGASQGLGRPGTKLVIDPLSLLIIGGAGVVVGGAVVLYLVRLTFPGVPMSQALASVGWRKAPPKAVLGGVAAGLGLSLFYLFVISTIFPAGEASHMGPLAEAASHPGLPRHIWALIALGLAPPTEEFVFRGVLFTGLSRSWGVVWAGIAVTALFAAGHLTEVVYYWPALISIALAGVVALIARLRSGSLAPAVAVHFTYNLGIVLALYTGLAK